MTEADILPRMAEMIADARAIRKEWRLSDMIDGASSANVSEMPMTPNQRAVLAFLAFGPARIAEVVRGTRLSESSVKGAFGSLILRGFIKCHIEGKAPSHVRVGAITDAGKQELGA